MPLSPRSIVPSAAPTHMLADASAKKPLKGKRRRSRGAEACLGAVDFAEPTGSADDAAKQPAAASAQKGKFSPKSATSSHLVVKKIANLFSDIVPDIEKSVNSQPSAPAAKEVDSRQPAKVSSASSTAAPVDAPRKKKLKRKRSSLAEEVQQSDKAEVVQSAAEKTDAPCKKKRRRKLGTEAESQVEASKSVSSAASDKETKKSPLPAPEPAISTQATCSVTEAAPVKKKLKRKAAVTAAGVSPDVKQKLPAKADTCDAPSKAPSTSQPADAKVVVLGAAAYRKAHGIQVTGSQVDPCETFDSIASEFGKPLVSALRTQGYVAPTPIQAHAWPVALRGQDMVAVAKTGSGKTCGFLLPVLAKLPSYGPTMVPTKGQPACPRVLVLAPTRELAQQIADEGNKFVQVACSRIVAIYGGVPKGDQVRELELGADIVVATPGRLLDFASDKADKKHPPLISMKSVAYLVLDEADRMLDMGFEPDIRKIVAACPPVKLPGTDNSIDLSGSVRQTLFFTATWPKAVEKTAKSLTTCAVQLRIGQVDGDKLTANKDITQKVMVIDEKQKLTHLNEILAKELGEGETAFVFAKTKRTCDYLEEKLWDEKEDLRIGTWCRAIHSHKEQWVRDEALATFRNITAGKDNGRKGILVATDVAARGLDIPGVALVVVYDFGGGNLGENSGVESYVHRIGRTGRAGKVGKAYTFFTEQDSGAFKFVELLKGAGQRVPWELQALAEKKGPGGKGGKQGKGGKGGKSSGKGSKGGGKGGKGGKGKGKNKGKSKGKGGKW